MSTNVKSAQIESQKFTMMLHLFGTFLGGALILNSFLLQIISPNFPEISSLCAFFGSIILGFPVMKNSFASLIKGELRMMELAALAIFASISLSEYQTAGLIAFFMLLSEILQSRTALGARSSIESLIRLSPTTACRLDSDRKEEIILVKNLKKDDVIRVRPGESIPADGEIILGQSVVSQAEITGESLPVEKNVGMEVFAGTSNITGVLEIKVTRAGEDTTLGKVKELILKAEVTKIPLMKLIDKHVKWYTPTILMLAGMILFFSRDMHRTITALVVTCPAAIILATPTALVAALSCAARLGILIKDVSHLELAATLDAVVFDKTGTLTTGELAVTRLTPAKAVDAAYLLQFAASVEKFSNHPIAKAIVKIAKEADVEFIEPQDIKEIPGKGVKARIRQKLVMVGRESWLREEGVDFSALDFEYADAAHYSTLYIAENRKCLGWIGLEDKTRKEAKEATKNLKELGCSQIIMLTGDRWAVARKVSEELGCTDVQAECLPETKLQIVEKIKKDGYKVVVVGDGVNDAPALASGNLGIAMGAAGSDVAINSASIALLNNNLDRLPFLIKLSRKTKIIIYENLILGGIFITGGLTLAGWGLLTPVIGAVLHNLGAFVIIFNSARLVRFGEDLAPHLHEMENKKED